MCTKRLSRAKPAAPLPLGTVASCVPRAAVRQVLQASQASPPSVFHSLGQSISLTHISAKQKLRKRVFDKIHGLKEGALNYTARNAPCCSRLCSLLTVYC